MERLRLIIRTLFGSLIAFMLAVGLAIQVPAIQQWLGSSVARVLSKTLHTSVSVGSVQAAINGRIVVYDLNVQDQQGRDMLRASRVGAKLNVWPLLKGKVRIGNAQLFGVQARLLQEHADSAANYQFIIDALSSNDTTPSALDLRIGQLLIRRANINYDKQWIPATPQRFNPAHLTLRGLNATVELNTLTPDTLNAELRRLDFYIPIDRAQGTDSCLFRMEGARAMLHANRQQAILSDFELRLPHSTLNIPSLNISRQSDANGMPKQAALNMNGEIHLPDLQFFLPQLQQMRNTMALDLGMQMQDGTARIQQLLVKESNGQAQLNATGRIDAIGMGKEALTAEAEVQQLRLNTAMLQPFIRSTLPIMLDSIGVKGKLSYTYHQTKAHIDVFTPHGNINLKGKRQRDGFFEANLATSHLALANLLQGTAKVPIQQISLNAYAKGNPKGNLQLQAEIAKLHSGKTLLHNIQLKAAKHAQGSYKGELNINDPHLNAQLQAAVNTTRHMLSADGNISHINPHALGLSKTEGDTYSGTLEARLDGEQWQNPEGHIHLNHLRMRSHNDSLTIGDIHITSHPEEQERHITLISPFLEAQVDGEFNVKNLVANAIEIIRTYVPTLSSQQIPTASANDYATLQMRLYDTRPISRILGIPLAIQGTVQAEASLDAATNTLTLSAQAPSVDYSNERLRNIMLRLEAGSQSLQNTLQLQRIMKSSTMDLSLETNSRNQQLHNRLYWNNNKSPEVSGDINVVASFFTDDNGKPAMCAAIEPSTLVIADSLWRLQPGAFSYENEALHIDSIRMGNGGHRIALRGTASNQPTDTLRADLRRVKLEYIFSLINFHAVELKGEATGRILATNLFSKPQADAYLQIPHFSLNDGDMGLLDIYGNWGKRPYSIYLDGIFTNMEREATSIVRGHITPKKDIEYHGLDLDIQADHLNMYFINKYAGAILHNLQGSASGWARLYGPFKQLNLEGDVVVDEGAFTIPYIGVRYHLQGDSVQLRPNNIYFPNATIYDPQGGPGIAGHQATVRGHLQHKSFSNMRFDIDIQGRNILGYDFKEFGGESFYGTVFADGDVKLTGEPGRVNIDIKATPLKGTTFTYNMNTPSHLKESQFVTYTSPDSLAPPLPLPDDTLVAAQPVLPPVNQMTDMRINFDLDITPQATMNLLMDARAGDMISVNGNGNIRANYHNKDGFRLYGTYRIDRGNYNMTLQNIIRKDFQLQNGSTITFAGDPMLGTLDVTALHTVTGVQLNDLSARATFSNNSARVNCIMNVGGIARQPHINFDFDILNVSEDEKQMIRSLISTEEERNMQVIYLLGIGRFYTYDYQNTEQSQSYTAMNSLLSSTLSGQINQMFQNIIGQRNWNIGANLNTGEMGWSDIDVEGAIQGSLLNNRLLINGNFGYRDTPNKVQQNNFVGDFDVQYHLTPSGSVSLKAYSETNDRYFTKSSLTTQGVGLLLKKDFSTLCELFSRRNRKKNLK